MRDGFDSRYPLHKKYMNYDSEVPKEVYAAALKAKANQVLSGPSAEENWTKMAVKMEELRKKYGNDLNYIEAYHLAQGSGIGDVEMKAFDLPGEDSIMDFMNSLEP